MDKDPKGKTLSDWDSQESKFRIAPNQIPLQTAWDTPGNCVHACTKNLAGEENVLA